MHYLPQETKLVKVARQRYEVVTRPVHAGVDPVRPVFQNEGQGAVFAANVRMDMAVGRELSMSSGSQSGRHLPEQMANENGKQPSTLRQVYRTFGRHYLTHWKLLLLSLVAMLTVIGAGLLIPWPLKLILDHVIYERTLPFEASFLNDWAGNDSRTLLPILVVGFVCLRIADSIVQYFYRIGMLILGAKISASIREQVFAHLQKLSLAFHNDTRSGDLVYRLTSDIAVINKLMITLPQLLLLHLGVIVAHIGMMYLLEWRLALLAFSVIPIMYWVQRRYGSGVQTAARTKRSKESNVSALVAENVRSMALVQAYGLEEQQRARFESENRLSLDAGITTIRLSKTFKRVNDLLVASGTASVLFYGGCLTLDGVISPGTLVLFADYLRRLYNPVDKLAGLMVDTARSKVGAERLLEVLRSNSTIEDAPDAVPAPRFKGQIEFRNVTFGYSQNLDVLQNLSLAVQPGETVAVVGESGAGKSTFVSLLMRFYDPQQGQVLIDTCDIRGLKLKSVREQMTVLLQEAPLFNQTVRENIRFGNSEATDEDIVAAAKLAQAHDFIMKMPEGYETVISEGGKNLSGGQMQRINISRAMVRNSPILMLDEPATALDARAAAEVRQSLERLTEGKTTFVIAHDFESTAFADKVLLLNVGRPAVFGTHEHLLRVSGEYRELCQLQGCSPLPGVPETSDPMISNV